MRRGNKPEAENYIKVRLEFLHEEKKKNDNQTAHLVLDKAIYELSIVLDLLTRNGVQHSLVVRLVWDQEVQGSNPCTPTKDYFTQRRGDEGTGPKLSQTIQSKNSGVE